MSWIVVTTKSGQRKPKEIIIVKHGTSSSSNLVIVEERSCCCANGRTKVPIEIENGTIPNVYHLLFSADVVVVAGSALIPRSWVTGWLLG